VDIPVGEAVYLRSFSTRRAAVAQVLGVTQADGHAWVHVRLVTGWYDWDTPALQARALPKKDEELLVAPTHLEAIRR
jgi:hypothetical protein